ncbi:MAG: 4Fe-4S binding protein [Anaerolineae bacterium]|nr:4Fe-4S binding protein [Anaerolineae bacterium]
MSRPEWFINIIQHFFPERFRIAGWTKKSKLIRTVVDFFLFSGDQIFYLPKDKVAAEILHPIPGDVEQSLFKTTPSTIHESNVTNESHSTATEVAVEIDIRQPIDSGTSISLPSTIIKEFIDEAGYVWLMDKCLCRDTMQCKDFPIEIGCIFMGEAVLGINPKFGKLASKEEAKARIDLAQEHGLVHLIGKNKIDTQWMGVHPGGKLLTVCSCCPCCCLYKVLPDLDKSIRDKIEKMPGLDIFIDAEECVGCGACAAPEICMTHNISIVDSIAMMDDVCVGCGRCYEVCPSGAIKMSITDGDFFEETIRRVKQKVDVS